MGTDVPWNDGDEETRDSSAPMLADARVDG
jgi:hypothetical protein